MVVVVVWVSPRIHGWTRPDQKKYRTKKRRKFCLFIIKGIDM
jgi:hypothetical protein